jgi:hypothetical protein
MDNYNHLTSKNILMSVPARDGHPGWLINNIPGKGSVVGWHQNLEIKTLASPTNGQEYDYLLADYEITEPYALEKIQNGTWRNRSSEISGYTTNDESEFWPVYMGFAFVDFPAVEGLNFSMSQGKFYSFFSGSSEENNVTSPTQGGVPGLQLPPPVMPTQQHVAPAPAPFVFSVNGQNETDFNKVQGHIRTLESFVSETRTAGRKAFVAALVADNKMMAPQQEGQEAFALSLTDEQYTAWKAGWETSPVQPLLANHGGGVSNATNSAQPNPQAQALADAREIVKMHEAAGSMPLAQLKAAASYKALIAAGERQA